MLRGSRRALLPLLALAFLLLGAREAEACSCARRGTVLDSFERADVVVVVRAVSVQRAAGQATQKPEEKPAQKSGKLEAKEEDEALRARYREVVSTTMVAEQVFKGGLKPGDEMVFAQGGGADCIYTFTEEDVGRRYLFYLNRFQDETVWIAGTCGRSGPVEYRRDDLLYLNDLSKARGRSRVSGTVFGGEGQPDVAGLKLRIVGVGKTHVLRTDEHGVYEIYDLPAGKYTLEVETPRGWKPSFYATASSDRDDDDDESESPKKTSFVLREKRHAGLDLRFEIDNAVAGKVYDTAGRPMDRVCLDLVPAEGETPEHFYESDCTEKGGKFRIEEIPPGSYVLVVNKEGKVTSSEPFGTFYYPNATRREDATVLHVGPGDFIENLQVHVPKAEETVTVEGLLLYSDGRPVVDELVEFRSEKNVDEDEYADAQTKTDARGRFSIRILKGMKGRLYGTFYTYSGKFENCPALERIIKQSGESSPEIKTPAHEFQAETNLYSVELRYPFPACKKARQSER